MDEECCTLPGEKIFDIRGLLCSKCLTIEPTIYSYGSSAKADISRGTFPIHKECKDEHGMSTAERHDYRVNTIRNSIIEKAIESSNLVTTSEAEMLEFLTYTKFGTFRLFRIGSPIQNSATSEHPDPVYLVFKPI